MSEWLDLMLDEISRKRVEAAEAAEEARRRTTPSEKGKAERLNQSNLGQSNLGQSKKRH